MAGSELADVRAVYRCGNRVGYRGGPGGVGDFGLGSQHGYKRGGLQYLLRRGAWDLNM